jgi:glucose uptake protein GlcU
MAPSLEACEVCGWMAAALSALAFGSFGVPIKGRAAQRLQIDPMVFQTYKTAVCFLTCWPILLALRHFQHQDHDNSQPLFNYTPWGLVSGLFWVPGGVATVYAVQSAGLAIGIGIGSSFIVLVSFVWGVFVFAEPIHSRAGATFAIACMMSGLLGMSYYSAPPPSTTPDPSVVATAHSDMTLDDDDEFGDDESFRGRASRGRRSILAPSNAGGAAPYNHPNGFPSYSGIQNREDDDDENDSSNLDGAAHVAFENARAMPRREHLSMDFLEHVSRNDDAMDDSDDDDVDDRPHAMASPTGVGGGSAVDSHPAQHAAVVFLGCKLTRRQAGMLAALFCGVWGGSITAPMAYAPPEARGTRYLASFAIGSSAVNFGMWVLRYLYMVRVLYRDQLRMGGGGGFAPVRPAVVPLLLAAYHALPSFHLRVMWLPGGLAGLLWSIGNFFSLISVFYLGEGVGYPLVQTSILISGLWGLFYYKEVTGLERRAKWFASSLLTICGILLLSYEHHSA